MIYIITLAIGYAAGVYREKISEKARELYIKISERR
jgi:hypothetical protein